MAKKATKKVTKKVTKKATKKATQKAAKPDVLVIPEVDMRITSLWVVSDSAIMFHNWNPKIIREIRDKQLGEAEKARENKNPREEFIAAMYVLSNGCMGFRADGFKAATINGARVVEGVTMIFLRQSIFIKPDDPATNLVQLYGPLICNDRYNEMPVRLKKAGADLRYRPMLWPWCAKLTVRHHASLSKTSVVSLINHGGLVGIGEWRPGSKTCDTGQYGMYHVAEASEQKLIKELVKKYNKPPKVPVHKHMEPK